MSPLVEDGNIPSTFRQQPDSTGNVVNPVSNTLYTILDTVLNAQLIAFTVSVTWATTQPTNLRVIITVDGQSIIYTEANPVSGTLYFPKAYSNNAPTGMSLSTTDPHTQNTPSVMLHEGASIKVEVAITWVTTQPTPIWYRVKDRKR